MVPENLSADTIAVHAGRPERIPGSPVNPPVSLSSTYIAAREGEKVEYAYAREDHETGVAFETALGALEGGHAVAYASGMGAISSALSLVSHGGVVVIPPVGYSGMLAATRALAESARIQLRVVDTTDLDQLAKALYGAEMLWLETPANPTLDITDLARASDLAHQHGVVVVADSTFSTPVLTRPLDFGVDVVVHSVTKWIAGHSDLILGAAVTRDEHLLERLRTSRAIGGATTGPFEAWLALRGLRTMPLRVRASCSSALELATRLQSASGISTVIYPGLESHPGHAIAKAQMSGGFGAVLSLTMSGGIEAARKLCDNVEIFTHATSVGGVESLIERRKRWPLESDLVPDSLVRISVGIEDVEDLWADLERALKRLT
ncbi:MAG TPA: aminotransferase class I/II-fold pyridoxal phosphate-dependent enzyme [Candidatus Nanopelagicaceae bacterium]|nr:aminotransferase class I/II-fold pyridoxal phosphate-dependent enzyme [Candidatus Nanopelagicaceae bacterium]